MKNNILYDVCDVHLSVHFSVRCTVFTKLIFIIVNSCSVFVKANHYFFISWTTTYRFKLIVMYSKLGIKSYLSHFPKIDFFSIEEDS